MESPCSAEPCIPLTLSNDDFMSFFTKKIVYMRHKFDRILSPSVTDVSVEPDLFLIFMSRQALCAESNNSFIQTMNLYFDPSQPES